MTDRTLTNDKITVEWIPRSRRSSAATGVVVGVRVRDAHTGDERVLDDN